MNVGNLVSPKGTREERVVDHKMSRTDIGSYWVVCLDEFKFLLSCFVDGRGLSSLLCCICDVKSCLLIGRHIATMFQTSRVGL